MKILFLFILVQFSILFAQNEKIVILETTNCNIEGSLLFPYKTNDIPVALIIAGSGPTDRDGNNSMMKNNSLKMLAYALEENGIASLRYDKRAIGKSIINNFDESKLIFDDYVNDVKSWIDFLNNDSSFNKIIAIGHSEGSLLGMIASQNTNVDKFISIAGAGESANLILRKQLAIQPKDFYETSLSYLDKLEKGETIESVDQNYYALFRPSIQSYLISWFKYNPQEEIAKLKIPILILQGTTDLQVKEEDANFLHKANPNSELIIIDGMNHVLKESEMDLQKNMQTYSNPELPLKDGLIESIVEFIKK
ncbi:MAG: alpha/beta hydrolase [Ignavibacteriae bacterium]|nr:alpha/beta hydrolase [Ignavibacteriota bacterium]